MLRASFSTAGVILTGVLALVLLTDAVVRGGWAQAVLLAPWILLFVWVAYVVWYAPSITVDDRAIVVHNYLRRAEVPWGRIADVTARWQLLLKLDDGRVVRALAVTARRTKDSTAGDDVEVVRERWEEALTVGASGGEIRRSWDAPVVAALAILAIWALIAMIISFTPL